MLPKFSNLAKKHFRIDIDASDIYTIRRLVRPGDLSEGYRGDFNSYLFTLVTPMPIADFKSVENSGQLHYFPGSRRQPKGETINILDKLLFKRHNSREGFEKLAQKKI